MEDNPLLSMMDFTWSGIISSVLFGIIGMWLFRWAKKRGEIQQIFIAVALMVYPYLTHGWFFDWGVGIALCGLSYYLANYRQTPMS